MNKQEGKVCCKGSFQVFDKDTGELLFENHNMFMNLALEAIAKWVAGDSTVLVPTVVKLALRLQMWLWGSLLCRALSWARKLWTRLKRLGLQ